MYGGNDHFQYSRAITLKVGKQELRFMCSARRLKNMSSGFKVMEWTRKLLTHKGQ